MADGFMKNTPRVVISIGQAKPTPTFEPWRKELIDLCREHSGKTLETESGLIRFRLATESVSAQRKPDGSAVILFEKTGFEVSRFSFEASAEQVTYLIRLLGGEPVNAGEVSPESRQTSSPESKAAPAVGPAPDGSQRACSEAPGPNPEAASPSGFRGALQRLLQGLARRLGE